MLRSLKQNWLKWLTRICLGISLLGGGTVAGCVWMTEQFSQHGQQNDLTAEQLEDYLGLKLPNHINQIHSHSDSWLDSHVMVRLHMPASSIPEFVERNGLVVKEVEASQLQLPQANQIEGLDWWNLEFDLNQTNDRWTDYQIPSVQWTAYGVPPDGSDYPESGDGATEQGFYVPSIVVIPTEKDYVYLYLYGFRP